MFRSTRRIVRLSGVRFCDSRAGVSTVAERARLHDERTATSALGQARPRRCPAGPSATSRFAAFAQATLPSAIGD